MWIESAKWKGRIEQNKQGYKIDDWNKKSPSPATQKKENDHRKRKSHAIFSASLDF